MDKLAINGGPRSLTADHEQMFHWPVVTAEDEAAVLAVLREGTTSQTELTKSFEKEFAEWIGTKYALGCCNGTAALTEAMWACGVGMGDEIICPSMTYWASCAPAPALGAAVNFCDIDPGTLCIDPEDIEHRIGPRTKAIIVVHYSGYPCDMDTIMAVARRHGVKVIEDVSHAQGSLYKGRMCGTIGDIAGISMMGGKSFAIGEGGMVITNNRELYERCIAYGHYERTIATKYSSDSMTMADRELAKFAGLPLGGVKHRMNQTCSAMGRVQLKHYPARIAEIRKAMNYFWDRLEGFPGIRAHRPADGSDSTMGGWYSPRGLYVKDELGGLSCADFCAAVSAEGVACVPGANAPLHLHPFFHDADIFNTGKPTVVAFGQRDVRQGRGALPVSESIGEIAFGVPWFKYYEKNIIDQYVGVFRKVIRNYKQLLR
ncbi:MAG: DegT/DnrJ/EryC1/StrS family aminotransferase [Victivallales bacterium]|nr:DegT/DnrJ/EryC1/StrS family aminotransferase [Victivallales bacterium]